MAFDFFVTSDWHIGSGKTLFDNILQKQIDEIHKIYQQALDMGISYIIIPGDISDTTNISTSEMIALVKLFSFYDKKITTYYIGGNHDYHSSNKSSVDLLKHLVNEKMFKTLYVITEPEHTVIEGVPVNFLPFPHTQLPSTKTGCINFVHMDTSGAVADNGLEIKLKTDTDFGTDNVTISGHVHMYQYIKSKRWLYCGNPYQKKFGEALPKGFLHCTAKHKDGIIKFGHKFIDNKPDFILKTVKINTLSDLSKLKSGNNVAYKLIPEEGLLLPSDISTKYNVASVHTKFVSNLAKIEKNSTITTGLKSFCADRELSEAMIKSAIKKVQDAREQYCI